MVGSRRIQSGSYGSQISCYSYLYSIPKKIHSVISEFAKITLKDKSADTAQSKGGLSAIIEQAKANKDIADFKKYVDNVYSAWFYMYVENFHCKPDSTEEMISGLKYLLYKRRSS
jgi:hypothetical protein